MEGVKLRDRNDELRAFVVVYQNQVRHVDHTKGKARRILRKREQKHGRACSLSRRYPEKKAVKAAEASRPKVSTDGLSVGGG